jgi:hypothetical protein
MNNSQSCYEFQQEKKILEIIVCNGTLQIIQQISLPIYCNFAFHTRRILLYTFVFTSDQYKQTRKRKIINSKLRKQVGIDPQIYKLVPGLIQHYGETL